MSDFYDRQGDKIGLHEWAKLCENRKYKILKQETLSDGKYISTVWLGLDHSYGHGSPLIFETMVFPKKNDWLDIDMVRYSTETEALLGHKALVDEWTSKTKKKWNGQIRQFIKGKHKYTKLRARKGGDTHK